MAPKSSLLLLLAILLSVIRAVYLSPYASRNTTDIYNRQPECSPPLTAISVLSAFICVYQAATCLLTGAVLGLCWDRRRLLRARGKVQECPQVPDNQYTAPGQESIRSENIYSNIESLYAAPRTDSLKSTSRPYPEFCSPVTYEEIDMDIFSCPARGSQQLDSDYTIFTEITV